MPKRTRDQTLGNLFTRDISGDNSDHGAGFTQSRRDSLDATSIHIVENEPCTLGGKTARDCGADAAAGAGDDGASPFESCVRGGGRAGETRGSTLRCCGWIPLRSRQNVDSPK